MYVQVHAILKYTAVPVGDDRGRLVIEYGNEFPPPAGGKTRPTLGERAERHGPVLPVAAPVVAAREEPRQGLEVHLGGECGPGHGAPTRIGNQQSALSQLNEHTQTKIPGASKTKTSLSYCRS